MGLAADVLGEGIRCLGMLAAAFGLQDFRHFVGSSVGGVTLEAAGNGEGDVAHADFGHAVWVADSVDLFTEGVGHRYSFP